MYYKVLVFGGTVPQVVHQPRAPTTGSYGITHSRRVQDLLQRRAGASDRELVSLVLGTKIAPEILQYPESNKVSAVVGEFPNMMLRNIFPMNADIDCWEGE